MSETKKKKKQIQEQVTKLEELIVESRKDAKAEEEFLKEARKKLAERDLSVEPFLAREKGALKRYNERRKMHSDIELMPKKEIVEEDF